MVPLLVPLEDLLQGQGGLRVDKNSLVLTLEDSTSTLNARTVLNLHPKFAVSSSEVTILCQVVFGLPCFLFPGGVHFSRLL